MKEHKFLKGNNISKQEKLQEIEAKCKNLQKIINSFSKNNPEKAEKYQMLLNKIFEKINQKKQLPKEKNINNIKIANLLREKAENMNDKIQHYLNPAISHQNPTYRRSNIAASMYTQGENLKKIQSIFYYLAEQWENNAFTNSLIDNVLKNIRSETDITSLLRGGYIESNPYPDTRKDLTTLINRIKKLGIKSKEEFETVKNFLKNIRTFELTEEEKKIRKIKQMENELRLTKIEGFFPTSNEELLGKIVNLANIQKGDTILEPSAGVGHIAEFIKKYYDNEIDCIEIAYTQREILKLKGFNVIADDFLFFYDKTYDVIIMNPPFEKMQDIDHVLHAYQLLNNGGRLIAIMSASTLNSSLSKRKEFLDFVNSVNGDFSEVIHDAFKGEFKTTGVSIVVLYIKK